VLDTRTGSPLLANNVRTVAVTGACGIPSSAVSVAANVTVVGPSFCWGNGNVGFTHDFRPGAGWTRIDAATAVGDPSQSGYVQVAVAYRVVTAATTDTVSWSNINTNEGAQIYTIALQ